MRKGNNGLDLDTKQKVSPINHDDLELPCRKKA